MTIDKMYVGQKFSLLMPEGDKMDFQVRRVTYDRVETDSFDVEYKSLHKAGIVKLDKNNYENAIITGTLSEYWRDQEHEAAWDAARAWNPSGINNCIG
jgi:hypothetical protein